MIELDMALLAWFGAYSDLCDSLADNAEADDDDPTVAEHIMEQMEVCVGIASVLIPKLGDALRNEQIQHEINNPPELVTAGDLVKPPF